MKDTAKIHVGYIVSILVSLNIVTLTAKWGAVKYLVTYVSFAATLASLLLAVLAIVYSYFSSGSLATYGERVSRASEELQSTYSELQRTTNDLKQVAENIPGAMTSLSEKVSQTQKFLENMSNPATSEKMAESDEEDVQIAVSLAQLTFGASPSGLLAMLACCEAYASKKHLDLTKLAKAGQVDESYLYGWIMALDAADLIDLQDKEGSAAIWSIERVTAGLRKFLEEAS